MNRQARRSESVLWQAGSPPGPTAKIAKLRQIKLRAFLRYTYVELEFPLALPLPTISNLPSLQH